MTESSEQQEPVSPDDERRPSWPYPQFIIIFMVLLLVAPALGVIAGNLLLWGWVGYYLWISLSRKAYEQMKASYPSLSRADYVLNMLLIPGIFLLLLILVIVIIAITSDAMPAGG